MDFYFPGDYITLHLHKLQLFPPVSGSFSYDVQIEFRMIKVRLAFFSYVDLHFYSVRYNREKRLSAWFFQS